MKEIDLVYADEIIKLCSQQYERLPKNGKPTNEEWTVVAAIVEDDGNVMRVVALGTGSKCVGRNALSPRGDIVHDAHAEVVARRGFLIYLMGEMEKWQQTKSSSVFDGIEEGHLLVKKNLRFCFVTSTVPCGDAAIFPMRAFSQDYINRKRKTTEKSESSSESVIRSANEKCPIIDGHPCEVPVKRQCVDHEGTSEELTDERLDIHRTGAKCLPNAIKKDLKEAGVNYHTIGQVRTKPGRGDPTCSVSCSDKLARWNAVGVQGAMLSLLLARPIHFACIVVAGGVPFSEDALERAINTRIGHPNKTRILQSQISFSVGRNQDRKRPAPCSIAWNLSTNQGQVCVEGRRLGATKGKAGQSSLEISKISLHKRFIEIISFLTELPLTLDRHRLCGLPYRELKDLAKSYKVSWKLVKDNYFKIWTEKPYGLESFKVS